MSLSTHTSKFLLDENVRYELLRFLKSCGIDVTTAPKSASDKQLALISHKESRVLITNDEDFASYVDHEVFSVIWLRIPQNDVDTLLRTVEELLLHNTAFAGKLVIVEKGKWDIIPLTKDIKTE